MKTTNNHELLRAYVQEHAEAAFQELVNRYVALVYSAAIRRVSGDRQLAEDVTQEVFTDLARKAAALPPTVMLGGWLHRHTGYVASTAMRREQRRRDRERKAVEMNALDDPSEADWRQFAPVLDEAMDEMDAADRDALVLRYFERCELRAVGVALGVSDDTAQKRVSRAVEKLRALLRHRGTSLTAAALGTALATEAVTAAPAGLAGSVAGTALASAAAGGFGVGVLKFLALTKAKLLVVTGLTALVAGWLFLPRLTSSGPANTARALPAKASAFVPFSVQGTLTYEVAGYPVLHRHFTVGVSNGLWHITVILEGKTGFLSFEYHYDGTNNLQYALFENSGPDVGSGSIETGPVPSSFASDEGEIVWLAYASGFYFHDLKGGTATSLERLRRGSLTRRYEVPAEWVLAREEPFLPSELTYYATNFAFLDDTGAVGFEPKPRYAAGHLRTWDPTTFRDMRIARQFEYIHYDLGRSGKHGISWIVRGHATNICSLIPFPTLPATLNLEDHRVPEPMVIYKVTNGSVPALETESMTNARAKGLRLFEGRQPRTNPDPRGNSRK